MYFNSIERDVDPVDAFWTDVARSIHKWIDAGNIIILLADSNVNVRSRKMVRILAEMGIREVILEIQGNNAPLTYNRYLTIVGGGYLPFGTCSWCKD
jgi:hypothetical protein